MDPDQTAPVGALRSGFIMFASMLMLNRHFQMQLFCWRVKGTYLSKARTCMKIFLYKQELLFCQGDGYFWPHCCMNNLYISHRSLTGPRSAVGNVSGYRCEADCRSRGREFDPGPVPYFRGD